MSLFPLMRQTFFLVKPIDLTACKSPIEEAKIFDAEMDRAVKMAVELGCRQIYAHVHKPTEHINVTFSFVE